jgi:ATP-dependent protease ClpP protease subunit
LNDEITVENSRDVQDFIIGCQHLNEVKSIHVAINSPGGSVFGGFSIYTELLNAQKEGKQIYTCIEGICASIVTIIFLAAPIQNRSMADFGLFMIHDPSGGNDKTLDAIKESLMTILKKSISGDVDAMMSEETWIDFEQCKKIGVIKSEIIMNKATELFNLVNKTLINKYKPKEDMALKPIDKMKNEDEEIEKPLPNEEEAMDESKEDTELSDEEKEDTELEDLKSEVARLKQELEKYKEDEETENKILLLNKAGISAKLHSAWLKQPLETIKDLTKDLPKWICR